MAVSAFGFAIVLTRLDAARANVVFRIASLAAGALGGLASVFGLIVFERASGLFAAWGI